MERRHTFCDVDAADLNAEDEHLLARIVRLRLGADLWNRDSPGAEVTQPV